MKKKVTGILYMAVILAIIGFVIYLCIARGSYPIRFKENLNALLGEGNWTVTDKENKTTSLLREYSEYGDTDGDYDKWYVAYKDENNSEQMLILNNLTHKVSAQKRSIFSSQYVSDEKCFGMNVYDEMEYLTEQDVYNNILKVYFTEEDFKYQDPKYTGLSVRVSADTVKVPSNDFYQDICDNKGGYYLPAFTSDDFLTMEDITAYVTIKVQTCEKTPEEIAETDETVKELVTSLCDRYREHGTFEVLVSHYADKDDTQDSKVDYGCFYWNGTEIPYEDIVSVSGEKYPDLAKYIKEQ